MQTKIRVSVTPYVHAYLATRYGPSPYDLTHSHRNDLRMAFSYMWMGVEFWPRIKHGHYVVIDLGKDHSLLRAYEYNRPFLKAGHFFQGEFMRAMRGYVRAQEALAKSLNIGPSSWNKKWAIDQFLKEHTVCQAHLTAGDRRLLLRHNKRLLLKHNTHVVFRQGSALSQ